MVSSFISNLHKSSTEIEGIFFSRGNFYIDWVTIYTKMLTYTQEFIAVAADAVVVGGKSFSDGVENRERNQN